ncbi:hypothetical protein N7481_011766 [Penicillium waksmanii]|uniref:uncharacterized protein n=1 Tax=Penicillium waksmanii TaxID=69791 RepID=UPI0025466EB3|nr:uncharacterized protein N7481_011766 [Penicillium waksmanii]KAJ5974556.1 hypothetical protein N7481_011766 [Penicillium waksmanii]
MAHQAHNIPWGLLASNLEWKTPTPWNNFATNLYPRMKPNQAKDLTHFVNAFVKNLDEHSVCERKKYQKHYDIPEPSDVILDDAIVRKISPTVRRWRNDWPKTETCPSGTCEKFEVAWETPMGIKRTELIDRCKCVPIPQEERVMSAFLREPHIEIDWNYSGDDSNDEAIFNIKFVFTLLLYGEMEPILRVCAHPAPGFWLDTNMPTYAICLHLPQYSVLLSRDLGFRIWPDRGKDYRNARFYQKTLIESGARDWDLRTYPHPQFFGMQSCHHPAENTGEGHWLLNEGLNKQRREDSRKRSFYGWWGYREQDNLAGPYGRVPIREFLTMNSPEGCSYVASLSEIDEVRSILCSMGLPVESALEIMKFANYKTPKSKLDPPQDPLHPANREALGQYLKYCWKTLVLCYTMAIEIGMDPLDRIEHADRDEGINWKNLVGDTIIDLFGHHKDRRKGRLNELEFDGQKLPRAWYKQESVSDDDAPIGWRGPYTIFV